MPKPNFTEELRKAAKQATSDEDHDALKLIKEEIAELQERHLAKLALITARSGVQEWKEIHELKTKFLDDLGKISKISSKVAMGLPNWFELCDPNNKSQKAMTVNEDWVQERLKGLSADDKKQLIAAMRTCAEEQRAKIWNLHTAKKRRYRKARNSGVLPGTTKVTKKKTTKKTAARTSSVVS